MPTDADINLLSDILDQITWLEYFLKYYSKYQPVVDEHGKTTNSFTGVVIPDWAVRQKLDSLKEIVAKVEATRNAGIGRLEERND